jgi:hypothetical protein
LKPIHATYRLQLAPGLDFDRTTVIGATSPAHPAMGRGEVPLSTLVEAFPVALLARSTDKGH